MRLNPKNLCKPTFVEENKEGIKWKCSVCGFSSTDIPSHFPNKIHRRCMPKLLFDHGDEINELEDNINLLQVDLNNKTTTINATEEPRKCHCNDNKLRLLDIKAKREEAKKRRSNA